MVVQHILCSRLGKREVKPIVPKVEASPEKNGNADKEESADDKNVDKESLKKEEEEEDADNTEKEVKVEGTTEDEEKSETQSTIKEEAKKEEPQVIESKAAETAIVEAKPQIIELEEYFVKYRNFSYLHCEWRTEEEMYKGDKRIQAKLKRFKQKQQQNTNIFENVFNINYF